ncbi:MAG: histidine--tRNA ligase [Hyphomicrobiaceae bacterium]
MAKTPQSNRPVARVPKGFRDTGPDEIRNLNRMLATIREVYESYGFEPLDTPAFEYTDALGKFLPDQDRPNEGVFSLQDEDEQWLSLRYDLTAPLARYVAENFDRLPKPFRRYATGPVWRNEKPGPGRFRQFTQFDADTVGTDNIAADAEICMLAADTLERLGIPRGQYVVKVNNRKVLDGVMAAAGIVPAKQLGVLRAIDKVDRLGIDNVRLLLAGGRKDESGDFTKGVELNDKQIDAIVDAFCGVETFKRVVDATSDELRDAYVISAEGEDWVFVNERQIDVWEGILSQTEVGREALSEMREIVGLVENIGYGTNRIRIGPSVVRGLEYYTGPVFEAELTFEVKDEDGNTVRFGSVGGGGRYDGLVERFTGQKVPATGFSIGVSRLASALQVLGRDSAAATTGPVVVLVMDKDRLADYQKLTRTLRDAGVRAEMYLGTAGMKAQMKYADRRRAPCVVIQGSQEREKGEIQIKDLIEGAKASESIKDAREWRESRPAQFSTAEADMVEAVKSVLARHQ